MWSVWKYSCKSLSWSTGERWTVVLESTMVYMDNSEYMWIGDLIPICCRPRRMPSTSYVTQNNSENCMGLITLANDCEVLTTLTPDIAIILSMIHACPIQGRARSTSALTFEWPIWFWSTGRARITGWASSTLWVAPKKKMRRIWAN